MKLNTWMPAAAAGHDRAGNPSASLAGRGGPSILVADDDENVRQLISCALAGNGFAVNAAADGEEAWEELQRNHYDLLITDNEMPRLAGIKLIERIRSAGMSLPVIMASGTFQAARSGSDAQLQITVVIPKPFEILELLDAVRWVLRPADENSGQCGGEPQPRFAGPETTS